MRIYNRSTLCNDIVAVNTTQIAPFAISNYLHKKRFQKGTEKACITTDKSPKEWVETIGDEVTTTAISDRLLYRCEIIKMTGESFRLKNRKTILKKHCKIHQF